MAQTNFYIEGAFIYMKTEELYESYLNQPVSRIIIMMEETNDWKRKY